MWAPLFCPRKFVADDMPMQLEDYRLTDAKLKNQGITITKLRKRFEREAMKTAEEKDFNVVDAEREVEVLAKIVKSRGT